MRQRKAVKGDTCSKCSAVPWKGEKVFTSGGRVLCCDCENMGFDDDKRRVS